VRPHSAHFFIQRCMIRAAVAHRRRENGSAVTATQRLDVGALYLFGVTRAVSLEAMGYEPDVAFPAGLVYTRRLLVKRSPRSMIADRAMVDMPTHRR
jgi:hypothetical protein